MPAWNTRIRTLRPIRKINDKIHAFKNHILASSCLPYSNGLRHFDDEHNRLLRDDVVAGRPSGETQMSERSPDLGLDRVVSRFVERPVMSSWLGVVPYRATTKGIGVSRNEDGPAEDDEFSYHYRLRRIQILDDQEDGELQDPPFITPIPSVKIDTPAAPRKSEGTYSRFHAMFESSIVSASFGDSRSLPLDALGDSSHQSPQRYPKLEAIFGPKDSVDASATDADRGFLAPDAAHLAIGPSGSKYKYMEEAERGSTELFLNAGIDHSFSRFLDTSNARHSSRDIDTSRFLRRRSGSILELPSIDSDSASADIQSQPRSEEAFEQVSKCPLSAGSSTSDDVGDAQPISVSISKLDSSLLTHPKSEANQQGELVKADEYSFITFATPNRISLAMPSAVSNLDRRTKVASSQTRSEVIRRSNRASEASRRRFHTMASNKGVMPFAGGKKVRIVEKPEVWSATIRGVSSLRGPLLPAHMTNGLPSLTPTASTEFARDLNHALSALDKDASQTKLASPLSSNAADTTSIFKNKVGIIDKVHFEAVLPPSALLSPVSKFSDGEATLYEPEPAAPLPLRRPRKFALRRKQQRPVIGVPLTRTKTRDQKRQHPAVYRKLLELYSLQYGSL
ncbi:hypothetical protein BKA70DRAFT_723724 [Coprinopsis sp. MPI-PUGE-AT-0042]|nr:hypothetical protein BKA70DRAFT_723724 [Coprinopsis sp. MPI-PUGE-AT-0042]